MRIKSAVWATLLAVGASTPVFSAADTIPYPGRGFANPNYIKFVATQTGPITAYFLGSHSKFVETVSVYAHGQYQTGPKLSNRQLTYGQRMEFGSAEAGDEVYISLAIPEVNVGIYSQKIVYAPGAALHNGIYVTAFSGDHDASIPAGTYVGFEDESYLWEGADWDYTDSEYVFTNLTPLLDR